VSEFTLIERLQTRTALERADVRVGIGDDAAVLAVPGDHELVVSTDTLVEGVHFPRGTAAFDIGWKALAVNLSDLAAMAATPAWVSLALTLPACDDAWLDGFAAGFAALAREHGVALIGGDTTRGPLTVTLTVHGFVPQGMAVRRSGARPGDVALTTGTLGDAAGGLALLGTKPSRAGERHPAWCEELLARLNRPTPRIAQGLALRGLASAAIDVSDGLVADLGHVCMASGVGAEVDLARLPASSALLGLFDEAERTALQLGGGDDYELCFTAAPEVAEGLIAELARLGGGVTRIGRIVEGRGVRVLDVDGREVVPPRRGYEHFA